MINKKTTCSVFNWLRLLEFAEWTLTPNKYKPIHSNSHPSTPYKDYSAELTNAKERFHSDWFELYYGTILRQTKWTESTAQFTTGDIVLISDLKSQLGYPVLGRIRSIEQDSDGLDRYYIVEYKTAQVNVRSTMVEKKFQFSKNLKQIKRRANSLVMVLGNFSDVNDYITDQQVLLKKKTNKVKVSFQDGNEKIVNI